MKQTTIQYQQTCEICGIVHENNGTICSTKCAEIWVEMILTIK